MSRNDGCRSANGSAAKFALQAFDRRPARESGTQAGRLCFYEADVVKTRGEYCFLFIFLHFNRVIRQQLTLWLWCLVVAVRGTSAAMIKGQSQLLFERAT